jgi:hypothetical protein
MQRQYFEGCFTEDDIKRRWRDLCKKHHPDLGGDLRTMQEVNAEYETSLRDMYRHTMDADKTEERIATDKETAAKVQEIILLDGLIVELCGRWVWVTGSTFEHRAALKTAGFRFAARKAAWYWHKPGDAPGKHRAWSLDQIRAAHGSMILRHDGTRAQQLCA